MRPAVAESGVREGLRVAYAVHFTASVFIHDDERSQLVDEERSLERLAPHDPGPAAYPHDRTGGGDGDARHERQVMGREVVVAITGGRPPPGPGTRLLPRVRRRPGTRAS